MLKQLIVLWLLVAALLLAGCAEAPAPAATAVLTTAVPETSATQAATAVEPAATVPTAAAPAATEPTADATTVAEPATVEPTPEPAAEPIEVTYFTPAQQEGPYYPVEKPADRDNNLVTLAGATGEPAGEQLVFGGKLYDANGRAVEAAVIEIWQTDANGIYLHPGDPNTTQRDPSFQFYGEAVTGPDGSYQFRTILPGEYEPRPRHIHVKVKLNGQELLTTQFYFAGETSLPGDGAQLLIALEAAQDAEGNSLWTGVRDVVLSMPVVP